MSKDTFLTPEEIYIKRLKEQLKLADKNYLDLKNCFDERIEEATTKALKEVVDFVQKNSNGPTIFNYPLGHTKLIEWGIISDTEPYTELKEQIKPEREVEEITTEIKKTIGSIEEQVIRFGE